MHAAELGAQRLARDAVGDLPAGHVVRLAERRHDEAAREEIRVAHQADVLASVEQDVLVDFVRQQEDVAPVYRRPQAVDVALVPHRAGGIVRRVDDEEPRVRPHRIAHPLPVDAEIRRGGGDVAADAAGQGHGGFVGVVARVEDDGLVARADHRRDGAEQRLGGTGRDGDFGGWVRGQPIQRGDFAGDGFAQRFDAGHRRILVAAMRGMVADALQQFRRAVEVRIALGEVEGALVGGKPRHHGEDRRADIRQLAFERRWRRQGRHPAKKARFCHSAAPREGIRGSCSRLCRPMANTGVPHWSQAV